MPTYHSSNVGARHSAAARAAPGAAGDQARRGSVLARHDHVAVGRDRRQLARVHAAVPRPRSPSRRAPRPGPRRHRPASPGPARARRHRPPCWPPRRTSARLRSAGRRSGGRGRAAGLRPGQGERGRDGGRQQHPEDDEGVDLVPLYDAALARTAPPARSARRPSPCWSSLIARPAPRIVGSPSTATTGIAIAWSARSAIRDHDRGPSIAAAPAPGSPATPGSAVLGARAHQAGSRVEPGPHLAVGGRGLHHVLDAALGQAVDRLGGGRRREVADQCGRSSVLGVRAAISSSPTVGPSPRCTRRSVRPRRCRG